MCTVLLPPGVNPIVVNKYTNVNAPPQDLAMQWGEEKLNTLL